MSEDITISKFKLHHFPGEYSDVIAMFDAKVGGFSIRRAQLKRSHESGLIFLNVARGDVRTGIGISLSHGPVRDALQAQAIEQYHQEGGT